MVLGVNQNCHTHVHLYDLYHPYCIIHSTQFHLLCSLHLVVSPGFYALRAAEEEREVEGRVAVGKLFGRLGRINEL